MIDLFLLVFLFNGEVYASGPFDAQECVIMSAAHPEPSKCVSQQNPQRPVPLPKYKFPYFEGVYHSQEIRTSNRLFEKCMGHVGCYVFSSPEYLERLQQANLAGYRRAQQELKILDKSKLE